MKTVSKTLYLIKKKKFLNTWRRNKVQREIMTITFRRWTTIRTPNKGRKISTGKKRTSRLFHLNTIRIRSNLCSANKWECWNRSRNKSRTSILCTSKKNNKWKKRFSWWMTLCTDFSNCLEKRRRLSRERGGLTGKSKTYIKKSRSTWGLK